MRPGAHRCVPGNVCVDGRDCWPLRGGGRGRSAAGDQAPRPQRQARCRSASPTGRPPEPRGRVGTDARVRPRRVRQDDAAHGVAGRRCRPRDGPSAWLSLDQSDNDPALFWAYLVAALQAADPGVGAGALVAPAVAPASTERVLGHAAQRPAAPPERRRPGARRLPRHRRSASVHDGMAFLLEHLPPQVHLVTRHPSRSGVAAGPDAGPGRAGRDPRRRSALHRTTRPRPTSAR